jgi:four helix bundle protein
LKYQGYRDLKVYQLAYKRAMELFHVTQKFPRDEKYSLVDQIRRSSRSVPANTAEAWKKRYYPRVFVHKMSDAASEATETEVWLDFSFDCAYMTKTQYDHFCQGYEEVNRMLHQIMNYPEKFCRTTTK